MVSELVKFLQENPEVDLEGEDDTKYDKKKFDRFYNLVQEEFPNAPFCISFSREVFLKLDEPFTDRKSIQIMDMNISTDNYFYSHLTEEQVNKMKKTIRVKQINGQPITLRQILITMMNHRHFKGIKQLDTHIFLEEIGFIYTGMYAAHFGS